jgi:hypothetical protein
MTRIYRICNSLEIFINRIIIILAVLELGTQSLKLARQVIYQLNYKPSPFCFSYFSDKVSYFLRASLAQQSSYIFFPNIWNCRHEPLCPAELYNSFWRVRKPCCKQSFMTQGEDASVPSGANL